MPEITELILADHERLRRLFAALDTASGSEESARNWEPIATLLLTHAAAEEQVFYPTLVREGRREKNETKDAISDHNKIRDAVRDARSARVGSDEWWKAVKRARDENSDHMAEEERGALADFRKDTSVELRHELGAQFERFKAEHPEAQGIDETDKSPRRYIAEHT